ARVVRQTHADRDASRALVQLGDIGVDVADRGDTRGLRDGGRGDAQAGSLVGLRTDDDLRSARGDRRPRILDAGHGAHLALQLLADGLEPGAGLAGEDDLQAGAAELRVVERQARVGDFAQVRAQPVADLADPGLALVL